MASASTAQRSYRCYYTPRDKGGYLVASDNGILPFVQVRANNAEGAHHAAHRVTGCPVADVQRIEHAS